MGLFSNLFQTKNNNRAKLIAEANVFIQQIKENKKLSIISPSAVILKNDEKAFLETTSNLMETRSAKGGRDQNTQEWKQLDTGQLVLTDKRLIFDGTKENRIMKLNQIISVQPWIDAIELAVEDRQKSILLSVDNPYIWSSVIRIIIAVKDPLDLSEVNLNIQLQ